MMVPYKPPHARGDNDPDSGDEKEGPWATFVAHRSKYEKGDPNSLYESVASLLRPDPEKWGNFCFCNPQSKAEEEGEGEVEYINGNPVPTRCTAECLKSKQWGVGALRQVVAEWVEEHPTEFMEKMKVYNAMWKPKKKKKKDTKDETKNAGGGGDDTQDKPSEGETQGEKSTDQQTSEDAEKTAKLAADLAKGYVARVLSSEKPAPGGALDLFILTEHLGISAAVYSPKDRGVTWFGPGEDWDGGLGSKCRSKPPEVVDAGAFMDVMDDAAAAMTFDDTDEEDGDQADDEGQDEGQDGQDESNSGSGGVTVTDVTQDDEDNADNGSGAAAGENTTQQQPVEQPAAVDPDDDGDVKAPLPVIFLLRTEAKGKATFDWIKGSVGKDSPDFEYRNVFFGYLERNRMVDAIKLAFRHLTPIKYSFDTDSLAGGFTNMFGGTGGTQTGFHMGRGASRSNDDGELIKMLECQVCNFVLYKEEGQEHFELTDARTGEGHLDFGDLYLTKTEIARRRKEQNMPVENARAQPKKSKYGSMSSESMSYLRCLECNKIFPASRATKHFDDTGHLDMMPHTAPKTQRSGSGDFGSSNRPRSLQRTGSGSNLKRPRPGSLTVPDAPVPPPNMDVPVPELKLPDHVRKKND